MIINFDHHAYLIEGSREDKEKILDLLSESGFNTKGNPDFYILESETLKIDEVREIEDFASRKAVGYDPVKSKDHGASKKVIVLFFNFITREAQNALLKTLEEPTANTHFIILAPSEEIFLATVKSRLEVLQTNLGRRPTSTQVEIEDFLKSPLKKRMEIVGKIIKEIKDEESDVGKSTAKNFIDSIIVTLREKNERLNKENASYLKNLIKYSGYLNDRAPSVKQILEYSAINLPK